MSLKPKDQRALLRLKEELLVEREYSVEERTKAAKEGAALKDGSFPIYTPADVEHATKLWGHSDNPGEAKAHIVARAKAIGAEEKLPYSWHTKGNSYMESIVADSPNGKAEKAATPSVSIREELEAMDAHIVESADGRHIVEVTLIRGGTSKNNHHYPTDTLLRAVHLFEGATAFADHNEDPNPLKRSVRDIVGYYKNPKLEQHQSGARIRAQLHLVPGTEWLFNIIRESQNHPNLCGLSIDALGELQEGTNSIADIKRVFSVDVVARPSAGGSFDRILAHETTPSAPARKDTHPMLCVHCNHDPCSCTNRTPENPAGTAQLQEGAPTAPATGAPTAVADPPNTIPNPPANDPSTTAPATPSTTIAQLVEQQRRDLAAAQAELAKVTDVLKPNGGSPTENATADITRLAEELKRDRDLTRSEATLERKLTEAQLPLPVEKKIRKAFAGQIFPAELLESTIADEKSTLAELTTMGQITGMGYERSVTVGMNEYEQLQAAFDKLFDLEESEQAKSVPGFQGLREAFYVATGADIMHQGGADRPLRENYSHSLRQYAAGRRLSEQEVLLREADVTTASFSQLLGTSMNKRLLKDYQAWPSEWQKFASIVAIKDFKTQTRVRLGAFGSLSTVAEDAAYTTLTTSDTSATYSPTKRGNLVQVTRETIINDDLYAIKQIPQKLAAAAAFTLAEFVYNLMAPSFGNVYDAHNLFDSINHLNTAIIAANLGTKNSGTALSSAALQTAIIAMRKQTNMAGKPIGLKPRYLLTVPDLEFTAMTLLRSAGLPGGSNNDINPMMGYAEPIISPQLNALASGPATTTAWIAIADPRVIDTLEVGFVGGQANPVLLIQDMPLYGLNFTQDTISYKVRHEYGGAVVDYRGFYLGNN